MTRVLALFALVFVFGCGDDDEPAPTEGLIGAEGGTLTGPNGVTLEIPPGAVSEPTMFAIREVDDATIPDDTELLGSAYQLTPEGFEFDLPVAITIPLDAATTDQIVMLHASNDAWDVAGAIEDEGDESVTGYATHFSLFALVQVVFEQAGCFAPTSCDLRCTSEPGLLPRKCTGRCEIAGTGTTGGLSCGADPISPTNRHGTVATCTCLRPRSGARPKRPNPFRVDFMQLLQNPAGITWYVATQCGWPCMDTPPDGGMDAATDAMTDGATDAEIDAPIDAETDAVVDAADGGTDAGDGATPGLHPWLTEGVTPTPLTTFPLVNVIDVVVAGNDVVWATSASLGGEPPAQIHRIGTDGAGEMVLSSPARDPSALAADGSVVFWAVPNTFGEVDGYIASYDTATDTAGTAIDGVDNGYALEVDATNVYWLETDEGRLWRAPRAMPSSATFQFVSPMHAELTTNDTSLFYLNAGAAPPTAIARYAKTLMGGTMDVVTEDFLGGSGYHTVRLVGANATVLYFLAAEFAAFPPYPATHLWRTAADGGSEPEDLYTFSTDLVIQSVIVRDDHAFIAGSGADGSGGFVVDYDLSSLAEPRLVASLPYVARLAANATQVFAVTPTGVYLVDP